LDDTVVVDAMTATFLLAAFAATAVKVVKHHTLAIDDIAAALLFTLI
tara:strand:- start:2005 stop:2145 length:141 start_codon:yes stop_codon:yes gene_type:complete